MLDNTPNQPTKFRTKNWVEINDESHGVYHVGSQFKFNTSMLSSMRRSSFCDYSDAYILRETIKVTITAQTQEQQQPLIIETKK